MSVLQAIRENSDQMTAIRRDLHAHPELGFEETRTAGIVAQTLRSLAIETHEGIGKTGVVGILRGKRAGARRVGLRADMDALPIQEMTNAPWRSTIPGKFHGCGHDGHTAMLLGAARYLANTRDFAGTIAFIFQPAEEGLGGARAMIADGLFDRFPCDELYALHNWPGAPEGMVGMRTGAAMAGADFFDVAIKGRGGHGAMPEFSRDPIMAGVALAQAMQTIVSRNVDPLKAAVVSITQFQGGSAYNVIPETVKLAGTLRAFDDDVRALVRQRIHDIAAGVAAAFAVEIAVDIRDIFSVLRNAPEQTRAIAKAAVDLFGADYVRTDEAPKMGSEDFADMALAAPSAYVWLGMGPGPGVHNPSYQFNDAILPIGAALLAEVARQRLQS